MISLALRLTRAFPIERYIQDTYFQLIFPVLVCLCILKISVETFDLNMLIFHIKLLTLRSSGIKPFPLD